VLVLDEPGNHLDVDTVDALAEALLAYQGTVIFTSHDRHFMKRVASCIVEVRDGRVVNYRGDYEAYLYAVNKEIEEGEREREGRSARPAPSRTVPEKPERAASRPAPKNGRAARKEIANLERTIAQLDTQKKEANHQLLQTTDPDEALRLHNEVAALTAQIAEAEDRWCQLQEEVAAE
jgi:ATP-binding cassette subfamily F protein 3